MEYYSLLLRAHSGWRYVVLLTLVLAILMSFAGWFGKKGFSSANRKVNLFALISAHIQFVLGLILYFISQNVQFDNMGATMKNDIARYWTVEHTTIMLIAIGLITVGHSKSKRQLSDIAKHRTVAIFYTIAILIIFAAIMMINDRPAWR